MTTGIISADGTFTARQMRTLLNPIQFQMSSKPMHPLTPAIPVGY